MKIKIEITGGNDTLIINKVAMAFALIFKQDIEHLEIIKDPTKPKLSFEFTNTPFYKIKKVDVQGFTDVYQQTYNLDSILTVMELGMVDEMQTHINRIKETISEQETECIKTLKLIRKFKSVK